MRKFFTGAPSNAGSSLILDVIADNCVGGRVWSLVSTLDVSGNTIYGVAYSETGRVWWHKTLASATDLFDYIDRHDRVPF